ncbi:LacI family DNA-binding transcriptional regulator [Marinitoga aeolica]|uniref:LacI family DNA-binding transcriptional regulator n=1 Tax=Marinitoga aeolica TaxID=2809031 RepID=A0ABY8PR46_9BACT|nr:LacI family DNA-binding transcriptional regulator [Marinitoga aeolica]WGS65087.1 LacI family DNA-binding transcriptional regulator [Marinitoga aeolica]
MANIEDVAKLANVSIATVSRVLNNKGKYSEKTKIKVLKAIEELNYKPSSQAKHLAKVKYGFKIGVLISSRIKNILEKKRNEYGEMDFYSTVLKGIYDGANENKAEIILMTFEEFINKKKECDGILVLGSDKIPDYILNCNIHKVLVDNYIVGKKINAIISNGFDGAYYVVDKMIKRNYKRIIHIHGPLEFYGFRRRFEGYELAMKQNNLLPITYEVAETQESINYIIDLILAKKPEVVFTSNDPIAIMVLNALKSKNVKVPENVQIIGFDDIVFSASTEPSLSTVKVFKYEMGNVALERVIELINGKNLHPYVTSLFTEFIERKSTKGV